MKPRTLVYLINVVSFLLMIVGIIDVKVYLYTILVILQIICLIIRTKYRIKYFK